MRRGLVVVMALLIACERDVIGVSSGAGCERVPCEVDAAIPMPGAEPQASPSDVEEMPLCEDTAPETMPPSLGTGGSSPAASSGGAASSSAATGDGAMSSMSMDAGRDGGSWNDAGEVGTPPDSGGERDGGFDAGRLEDAAVACPPADFAENAPCELEGFSCDACLNLCCNGCNGPFYSCTDGRWQSGGPLDCVNQFNCPVGPEGGAGGGD